MGTTFWRFCPEISMGIFGKNSLFALYLENPGLNEESCLNLKIIWICVFTERHRASTKNIRVFLGWLVHSLEIQYLTASTAWVVSVSWKISPPATNSLEVNMFLNILVVVEHLKKYMRKSNWIISPEGRKEHVYLGSFQNTQTVDHEDQ